MSKSELRIEKKFEKIVKYIYTNKVFFVQSKINKK